MIYLGAEAPHPKPVSEATFRIIQPRTSDSYHIILQCFMNTFLLHANLKPSGQETPYCWLYILNQNVFELCKPEGYE